MNNLKNQPKGFDAIVAKVQTSLYSNLDQKWGGSLDSYPVCYPIIENDKRTIRWYNTNGDIDMLNVAEKNKFWFTHTYPVQAVSGQIGQYSTRFDLFFAVNLPEILPDVQGRADNEARIDVMNVLDKLGDVVKVIDVYLDIDQVYRGYDYRQSDDVQPYHCFRITLNAFNYNNQQIIC